MGQRINIILAEGTIRAIDAMTPRGERSRFIQQAVEHYMMTASPEALEERLRKAAQRDRDLDREIVEDWSAVDQEQWQQPNVRNTKAEDLTPRGRKSTSRHSTRPSGTKSARPARP